MVEKASAKNQSPEIISSTWISFKDVTPLTICAIVKSEDRHFFEHRGIDLRQLLKTIRSYIFSGTTGGGSTISQQAARNLFLTPKRSWWRKFREIWWTYGLEFRFTKVEILELYMNGAEWGVDVWGIRGAANHYFQREPKDLFPAQAIFLASILPDPAGSLDASRMERTAAVFRRVTGQLQRSGYFEAGSATQLKEVWKEFEARVRDGVSTAVALEALNVPIELLPVSTKDSENACVDP